MKQALRFLPLLAFWACSQKPQSPPSVAPRFITDTLPYDSDDPAFWLHPTQPDSSLFWGTDKDENGGVYAFNLQGKKLNHLSVFPLNRPNNCHIVQGVQLGQMGTKDLLLVSERHSHNLRVYSLPDMTPLDGGGLPMFEGETGNEYRDLMGVTGYKTNNSQGVYVFIGRKNGPKNGYIWQYWLQADSLNQGLKAQLVRKIGRFSGKKEIEALCVDTQNQHLYYSDEQVGLRQYQAHAQADTNQIALFGTTQFAEDHEGIALYQPQSGQSMLVVSDQGAGRLQFFQAQPPHKHLGYTLYQAKETDGIEIHSGPLSQFPGGLLIAMSDDKTFHLYAMNDLLQAMVKTP